MGSASDNFINAMSDLSVEWRKLAKTGHGEQHGHQRFGQYVMNSGKLGDRIPKQWPELFYAEEYNIAYGLLYRHSFTLGN